MIGSINARSVSPMKFGRKKLTFDGTIKNLVEVAVAAGAIVGDRVFADFGAGFKSYTLYSNPADTRVGGVWASRTTSHCATKDRSRTDLTQSEKGPLEQTLAAWTAAHERKLRKKKR